MAKEIEKKFLVRGTAYRSLAAPVHYHQGYIPTTNGITVRVRVAGERGFLTLKTRATGIVRDEYEYEIPVAEAEAMLRQMCATPTVEKYRYRIDAGGGLAWEVDEFLGENAGLVIAEIELPAEDTPFALPDWVGAEVTGDKRYYNSALCRRPFSQWG